MPRLRCCARVSGLFPAALLASCPPSLALDAPLHAQGAEQHRGRSPSARGHGTRWPSRAELAWASLRLAGTSLAWQPPGAQRQSVRGPACGPAVLPLPPRAEPGRASTLPPPGSAHGLGLPGLPTTPWPAQRQRHRTPPRHPRPGGSASSPSCVCGTGGQGPGPTQGAGSGGPWPGLPHRAGLQGSAPPQPGPPGPCPPADRKRPALAQAPTLATVPGRGHLREPQPLPLLSVQLGEDAARAGLPSAPPVLGGARPSWGRGWNQGSGAGRSSTRLVTASGSRGGAWLCPPCPRMSATPPHWSPGPSSGIYPRRMTVVCWAAGGPGRSPHPIS